MGGQDTRKMKTIEEAAQDIKKANDAVLELARAITEQHPYTEPEMETVAIWKDEWQRIRDLARKVLGKEKP